jgi:hypothetical protein
MSTLSYNYNDGCAQLGGHRLLNKMSGYVDRRACTSCLMVKRKIDFPPLSTESLCRGCILLPKTPTAARTHPQDNVIDDQLTPGVVMVVPVVATPRTRQQQAPNHAPRFILADGAEFV